MRIEKTTRGTNRTRVSVLAEGEPVVKFVAGKMVFQITTKAHDVDVIVDPADLTKVGDVVNSAGAYQTALRGETAPPPRP